MVLPDEPLDHLVREHGDHVVSALRAAEPPLGRTVGDLAPDCVERRPDRRGDIGLRTSVDDLDLDLHRIDVEASTVVPALRPDEIDRVVAERTTDVPHRVGLVGDPVRQRRPDLLEATHRAVDRQEPLLAEVVGEVADVMFGRGGPNQSLGFGRGQELREPVEECSPAPGHPESLSTRPSQRKTGDHALDSGRAPAGVTRGTPSVATMMQNHPHQRIDGGTRGVTKRGEARYRLLDVLGHGAAGVVHLAYDRVGRRYVAAKVLLDPRADELARLRFLAEQNLSVRHPHVLRALDWYQGPGVAVMITELADAGNLHELLDANATLPADLVEQLARQSASGLAHLHHAGIVHRDMKPANILLRRVGRGITAKVGDLGVAVAAGRPRLTQDHAVVGTIGHLAPEVLAGGDHSPRSDVWALGRTLADLVGRTNGALPDRLLTTIAAMTDPDPAARPASAVEVVQVLGEPVIAGVRVPDRVRLPDKALRRIERRRLLQRSRVVSAAAATVAVIALLAGRFMNSPSVDAGEAVPTRVGGVSTTRAPAATTTTAPPATTSTTPLAPLSNRDCYVAVLNGTKHLGMTQIRYFNWLIGMPSELAFGYGTFGFVEVSDYIREFLNWAAVTLPDQGTNVLIVGAVDDQFASAYLVEWLARSHVVGTPDVDPATAAEQAAKLVGGTSSDPAATTARLLDRLNAFEAINHRVAAAGCGSTYPNAPRLAPAQMEVVFGTPIETLQQLFDRYDLARVVGG